jgi:signal transduction histidine kinase
LLDLLLHSLLDAARQDDEREVASSGSRLRTLQKALATTHKIARLINDFADVTLSSEGKLQLQRSDADLMRIIREVIDRNEKLDDQAPPVRLDGPTAMPGNWDRMRLDQVIANLLANAAKHSNGNPIDVIVSADEAVARVEVRDCGVGIPADRLETIFESFETTALPNHGHFGMGLWVVSLIIRSMGGKVSVSSVEGQGSSFVVELPRR